MNVPKNIHFRDSHWWSAEGNAIVRGSAFDGSALLDSRELALRFAAAGNRDEFVALLERLNGFFAVVQFAEDEYRLGVDRVRSIPLFYGISDKSVWIGDDCHWVAEQSGNQPWDEVFAAEFYHTGYVTSRDTLVPNVKQCMAGEAVFINIENDGIVQSPRRYFRYRHKIPERYDANLLFENHEKTLVAIFRRLISFANGRTVVIPLSGGYDSRLVALMLKRLEYPHVVCFSYGRLGNEETAISRQVAKDMGFEWKFVPYSNEMWAECYHSNERLAYERYSGTLCSLPHMQDWPAVKRLCDWGDISPDSVVVPGHTGDLLGGGRSISYPRIYRDKQINNSQVVNGLLTYHYQLWPLERSAKEIQISICNRLRQQIEDIANDRALNNAGIFETWNVENRQAKFIINSIRVYDFYKLSWWLPLWDNQYMGFWASFPLELRRNKQWYNSAVNALYQRISGRTAPTNIKSAPAQFDIKSPLKSVLRKIPFLRVVNRYITRNIKRKQLLANDFLCRMGIISEKQLKHIWTGHERHLSLHVAHLLGKISIDDPRKDMF